MDNLDIDNLYCLYLRTYVLAMRGAEVYLPSSKPGEQEALAAVALAVYHAAPAHGEDEKQPGGFDNRDEFVATLRRALKVE
jgi:hypothetical protein